MGAARIIHASPLHSPIYLLPVGDGDLAIIGRVTLMWAQIDMQLDQLLKNLLSLTDNEYDDLFGNRMIGAKAATLLKFVTRCRDTEVASLVRDFVSSVQVCAADRNLITHGAWGWLWRPESGVWIAAACSRSRSSCFDAADLQAFHNQVVATCKQADVAYYRQVVGTEAPDQINREMLFCPTDPSALPPAPKGFNR